MTISDVSEKFQMNKDTLRYYEKIGLIGNINKNSSGHRVYTEQDLLRIECIINLKKAGLSLEKIKNYIELSNKGNKTVNERLEILLYEKEKLNNHISELEKAMKYIDYKINNYEKLNL